MHSKRFWILLWHLQCRFLQRKPIKNYWIKCKPTLVWAWSSINQCYSSLLWPWLGRIQTSHGIAWAKRSGKSRHSQEASSRSLICTYALSTSRHSNSLWMVKHKQWMTYWRRSTQVWISPSNQIQMTNYPTANNCRLSRLLQCKVACKSVSLFSKQSTAFLTTWTSCLTCSMTQAQACPQTWFCLIRGQCWKASESQYTIPTRPQSLWLLTAQTRECGSWMRPRASVKCRKFFRRRLMIRTWQTSSRTGWNH
jgi:hypothetical protein